MRCYVSEFLDKSYDEGVYFALVTKMDCLKPPGRPTRAFKRCRREKTRWRGLGGVTDLRQ